MACSWSNSWRQPRRGKWPINGAPHNGPRIARGRLLLAGLQQGFLSLGAAQHSPSWWPEGELRVCDANIPPTWCIRDNFVASLQEARSTRDTNTLTQALSRIRPTAIRVNHGASTCGALAAVSTCSISGSKRPGGPWSRLGLASRVTSALVGGAALGQAG